MGLCAQAVALRLPLSENERVEFNSFIEGHDSSAALPRTVVDSIRKIEEGVIAARSLCGPGFDFLPLSVDKLTFTSLVGLVTARTR
jgi:hypothetical protein